VQVVLHAEDDSQTVVREVFTLTREAALAPDKCRLCELECGLNRASGAKNPGVGHPERPDRGRPHPFRHVARPPRSASDQAARLSGSGATSASLRTSPTDCSGPAARLTPRENR